MPSRVGNRVYAGSSPELKRRKVGFKKMREISDLSRVRG